MRTARTLILVVGMMILGSPVVLADNPSVRIPTPDGAVGIANAAVAASVANVAGDVANGAAGGAVGAVAGNATAAATAVTDGLTKENRLVVPTDEVGAAFGAVGKAGQDEVGIATRAAQGTLGAANENATLKIREATKAVNGSLALVAAADGAVNSLALQAQEATCNQVGSIVNGCAAGSVGDNAVSLAKALAGTLVGTGLSTVNGAVTPTLNGATLGACNALHAPACPDPIPQVP